MIGFDDFLDGYLPTELDEITDNIIENTDENNFNSLNEQNFDFKKKEPSLIVEVAPFEEEEANVLQISSTEIFHDALEFDFDQFETVESVLIEEPSSDFVVCEIDNDLQESEEEETEPLQFTEMCKLCNCSDSCNYDGDTDCWLICYGCGEAFHRKCLTDRLKRIKCEMPLIFRNRITGPESEKKYSHAPWFCNNCVQCSCCNDYNAEELRISNEKVNFLFKDSFVACRHCGKVSCLSCYNSQSFNTNYSHQMSRFENLQNYSCPGCLQCINCGLSAAVPKDPFSTKSKRRTSICAQKLQQNLVKSTPSITLYKDLTLCRPCYLSDQLCATCPRCKQIYHSLQDHYDFGETPFNSDFSLCPMIMCDDCGSWTHCQCEGIDNEEYDRLGTDKTAKFKCFDCRKNSKKRSKQHKISVQSSEFRRGNVVLIEKNKIVFMYWSFDETWIRKLYEFSYQITKKGLIFNFKAHEKDSKFHVESDSIECLSEKFAEMFKGNSSKIVKCIDPKYFLNPMSLLTIFETSKTPKPTEFKEICSYLRDEIGKDDRFSCARTESIFKVKDAFARRSIPKNPTGLIQTSIPSGLSSPTVSVGSSGGKTGLKYIYLQYSQSVKSDTSCYTIDSISQGLALRPSSIAGFGLFATKQFQKNSLIIEYCGEMLTGDDLVDKRDVYYNALGKRYRQSCYLFRLDERKVLDATHKGNLSRFINHSCDPNCYSRVVQIDEAKKLLIFASRLIEVGEEILYDYKFPDEEQKIPCLCGSEKCRKWMN